MDSEHQRKSTPLNLEWLSATLTKRLVDDQQCQKVYKMKIDKDFRKYTVPSRGSKGWKEIYKNRTEAEYVSGYSKGFFQLNNVRYCTGIE
jgi:hypothetical protein